MINSALVELIFFIFVTVCLTATKVGQKVVAEIDLC